MSDLFAILYTPGSGKATKEGLINKFKNIIDQLNIGKVKIKVNPKSPINVYLADKSNELLTVVIGWGLREKPSWKTIIPDSKYLESVRQLVAIDLLERKGSDGRVLDTLMITTEKYRNRNTNRNKQDLFFEGHFLQTSIPYGLKRVQVFDLKENNPSSVPLFAFEPGEPSEVEIVRMIFDLFVNHNYNRSEICNLLNAQEIDAPKNCKAWNQKKIKSILACPLYIGANQYLEFIKFDVFKPIIKKSVYFESQALLSKMDIVIRNVTFR